jgi:hypothetical protein
MTITHHTMTPEITRDHAFPADLPTLVARGVVVHRGGRRLLDDVTVSLAADELVAVVGASGAEEHPARLVGGPDHPRVRLGRPRGPGQRADRLAVPTR